MWTVVITPPWVLEFTANPRQSLVGGRSGHSQAESSLRSSLKSESTWVADITRAASGPSIFGGFDVDNDQSGRPVGIPCWAAAIYI